jgi:hypothetical protein
MDVIYHGSGAGAWPVHKLVLSFPRDPHDESEGEPKESFAD